MASVAAVRCAVEALASRSSTNARAHGIASQGWCVAKGNAEPLKWVTPAKGIRSVVPRCTAQNLGLNARSLPEINAGPERAALRDKIAKQSMMRPDWVCAVGVPVNLLVTGLPRIALEMPASPARSTATARVMSVVRTIAAKAPLKAVSATRTALGPCRFVLRGAALNAAPIDIVTTGKHAPIINALAQTKDAPQIRNVHKTNAAATDNA